MFLRNTLVSDSLAARRFAAMMVIFCIQLYVKRSPSERQSGKRQGIMIQNLLSISNRSVDRDMLGDITILRSVHTTPQLQILLFPNALCCSLYERNYVCAVTKVFTKFLPANNFCQFLRVTRKRSCTSAGNAQAQLHFRDDQQRAFGISNISNCVALRCRTVPPGGTHI